MRVWMIASSLALLGGLALAGPAAPEAQAAPLPGLDRTLGAADVYVGFGYAWRPYRRRTCVRRRVCVRRYAHARPVVTYGWYGEYPGYSHGYWARPRWYGYGYHGAYRRYGYAGHRYYRGYHRGHARHGSRRAVGRRR